MTVFSEKGGICLTHCTGGLVICERKKTYKIFLKIVEEKQ